MKTEFMHDVVRKRERQERNSLPPYVRQAYEDLQRQMEESYRNLYSVDARAREAIDRYMNTATSNPAIGMTMVMPTLDMNGPAGLIGTTNITYRFESGAQGYRGWVRIS